MLKLWQTIDLFGKVGATRAAWQAALADDFDAWCGFLQARDTVDSIEDPDFPGEILELEKPSTGDFIAFSTAIPAHRPPLRVNRSLCVRLAPDLRALAALLAGKLGFEAAESPRWSDSCFHEVGSLLLDRDNPRPVHLFIPDARSRQAVMKAGICCAPHGIVLLPVAAGYTSEVAALAAERATHVRVLATRTGLDRLSIAPPTRSVRGRKNPVRTPLFTPKKGWRWKDLTIVMRSDGLQFAIRGEARFQSWAELRMRPVMSGQPNATLDILGRLANGERLTQRRADVNARQQISEARQFLKELIPIRDDDPFKKFSDGWGVEFRVDGTAARKQVAHWEAGDDDEEFQPDAPRSAFDPSEENYRTFQT
ncbi:MAG: hypothetical protein J0M04_05770 [Verrucomicrobia bacterium]|nr:hypothetical protein [Verrucomicrobiota bacterium]